MKLNHINGGRLIEIIFHPTFFIKVIRRVINWYNQKLTRLRIYYVSRSNTEMRIQS